MNRLNRSIRPVVTLALLLVGSAAYATGPDVPISILPGRNTSSSGLPDLEFALATNDLLDIEIKSTVLSPGGIVQIVTAATGVLITGRASGPTGVRSAAAGQVAAAAGDTIRLSNPHSQSLPVGLYAEQLTITIVMRTADAPYDMTLFRYFEVDSGGIKPLTLEGYSASVDPEVVIGGLKARPGTAVRSNPALQRTQVSFATPLQPLDTRGSLDHSEVGQP